MEINSLKFIIFVVAVILAYFITPKKYKWIILLISSYLFYWINSNKLIVFICITTISIYLLGLLLGRIDKKIEIECKNLEKEEKKKLKAKAKSKKKLVVAVTLIINLGILGVVKYFNFFSGNINGILDIFNINIQIPSMQFVLPLGISYYTLQALSYIIDVYKQKIQPDKNLGKVALFLVFFPQILEGPNGIKFLELNCVDEIGIDWNTDTQDGGWHLNTNGAVKVSKYLANYLKENFNLTDKRENKDYQDWNQDLEKYLEDK